MPDESSVSRILVHRPEAGQSVDIQVKPGCVYVLEFNQMEATFVVQHHDMQMGFDDGALVTLHGFCSASQERDTVLELHDGTQISGQDLAAALAMTLQDFHTDGASPPLGLETDPEADAGGHPFLVSATVALPHDLSHSGLSPDQGETAPDSAGYFITSHGARQPLSGLFPYSPDSADQGLLPFAAPGHQEVLLLEDLLDTSGAIAGQELFPPAFTSLFPDPGDLLCHAPPSSVPLSLPDVSFSAGPPAPQDDSLDSLLTVLRLTSF